MEEVITAWVDSKEIGFIDLSAAATSTGQEAVEEGVDDSDVESVDSGVVDSSDDEDPEQGCPVGLACS